MLDAFLASLFLIFLSEIADKTQLVIFALAVNYKKPWHIFAGALTAHAFMDGVGIVIGAYTALNLPRNVLSWVIGLSFIILGAWGLVKRFLLKKKSTKKKKENAPLPYGAMLTSFVLIMASELGDKSQLASGILAASFREPFFVFLGTVAALTLAIGLNIFVGSKLADKLPERLIKILTSVLFIAFGLVTLLFG